MDANENIVQRHDRILGELAELGLSLARDLHARAIATQDETQAQGLATAFHRIARDVRLTLALESRLTRERLEIAKTVRARALVETLDRTHRLRTALTRDILRETEGEAARELLEDLSERLEVEALFEAFLDGPLDAAIARLRADLGLPANDAAPRPASPDPAPAPADRRSSA